MPARYRLRVAVSILALAGVATPAAALAAKSPKLLPSISRFSPGTVATMAKIDVVGKHFTHVKSVKVDGLKARFKVDSATKLVVTVPAKAKSGRIAVTTSAGTARSAHALKIKA